MNNNAHRFASHIPGPRPHGLLGWRADLIEFALDSVGFLSRLHRDFGSIARVGQGRMAATFTFHPDLTRQILSNPSLFYSFELEDIPFPFSDIESLRSLTTALAMMNGEQHRIQRRLMAPAFHVSRLQLYVNEIVDITETFFAAWKPGAVLDLYSQMDLFTVWLAMKLFLGMDPTNESRHFADLFERVLKLLFSPGVFLMPYDLPGMPYRRLIREGTRLESDLKALIQRRRERGLDGNDMLSMFLQTHDEDGNLMTDNEIVGQTVAVFRGGSKTSASTLTWTWFLLAQHPRLLADLLDELDSTLHGAPPTFEQMTRGLPLLDAVIKESMRLIPPVVWGTRYSIEPFELGGYQHEKGSLVIYSSHVTHRMPALYPQPNRFIPSRWSDIRPSPYEYFPFSAGPRRCLGAEFAMIEMKIVLAIMLQRFRLSILPGQTIDRVGITGSLPRRGIKVRVEKQDRAFDITPVRGTIHRLVELPGGQFQHKVTKTRSHQVL